MNKVSPFKTMLKEDLKIFLNIDELGEIITINNKEYNAVIEYPSKEFSIGEEGIAEAVSFIIYLEEMSELKKYKTGKSIIINGNPYIINHSYVEEGLRIIKLSENRGY